MRIIITLLFICLISRTYGQRKNDIIQQRIEFIAEELETEDIALEDVFDVLYYYYDNPVNLNSASRLDLEEMFLLSDAQINALLSYIQKNGELESLYQLQEVDFWDILTIENVSPFVVIRPSKEDKKKDRKNIKEFFDEGRTEIFLRWIRGLEERAGYEDVPDSIREQSNAYYWGSPDRVYSRIRHTYRKNTSIGVTMEKDPGEEFFGTTQPYGFDFYSAHAYYNNPSKFVRTVALGDYQMEIGQGLALWTGYAFNKTVDAMGVRKNARGLRPYTSVDETRFLRGAGVEIGVDNFSLTTFASHKAVNGTVQLLDTLDGEEARQASSINLSGLHRTTGEIARKNSIQETIFGANANYKNNNFQAGVSAVQHFYDTPLERADRPVNQYEFSGDNLLNLSADYSYIIRNISVFGEVAQSRTSGSIAYLQGLVFAINKRASISAVYRNYPKDYHTFYSRGFGEYSRTINESGVYLGTQLKLNESWTLSGYADMFQRSWLAFRVDTPSDGHEFLAQLKYRPHPRLEVFLRAREQRKMQNIRNFSGGNMRPVEDFYQRVYRLAFNYKISKSFQWKTRIDYVTDERESMGLQRGVSLAQDLIYKLPNVPLQFSMRYAIFDTESFDARIYAYESHMQNVFSIPVYFNQGSRAYILMRYTFWKNKCDLWLRYAAFVFANQDVIGTGPERINGSVRSEVGAQLRIRF